MIWMVIKIDREFISLSKKTALMCLHFKCSSSAGNYEYNLIIFSVFKPVSHFKLLAFH